MNHHPASGKQRSFAKHMRSNLTDAELKLWNELRAHRLMGIKFRRQVPFGNYIVDFACPAHKLIIEIDGSGHGESVQQSYDTERTSYLESIGWRLIRFWNADVISDVDGVCSHILAVIDEMGPNTNEK